MSEAASNVAIPVELCRVDDLVPGAGVAVLHEGDQIALFFLPDETPAVYALSNHDPFSGANVLSRGIVGDRGGELVVASPIYKQHFSLVSGQCQEDPEVVLDTWPVSLTDDVVTLAV